MGPSDQGDVTLGAHPWNLRLHIGDGAGLDDAWRVTGPLQSALDDGGRTRVHVGGLSAFVPAGEAVPARGTIVTLHGPADSVHAFPASQEPTP
ncbi:hypothetical protein GKE82_02460 [Conexibacter sp. W3-3-2]|nr:hypothetical protein [Conexibacter sp. W3-3-2]